MISVTWLILYYRLTLSNEMTNLTIFIPDIYLRYLWTIKYLRDSWIIWLFFLRFIINVNCQKIIDRTFGWLADVKDLKDVFKHNSLKYNKDFF